MDFPDGIIQRHPDFVAIAAANTFGRGADRQYVGRYQLDAATLDRFVMLSWEYDSALESAILGLPRPDDAPTPVNVAPIFDAGAMSAHAAQWIARVQSVRARLELNKIRHVVSPRATINGVKLIAAGWPRFEIEESVLWKGLDHDSRRKAA
jgi:MoxR-like ATPase